MRFISKNASYSSYSVYVVQDDCTCDKKDDIEREAKTQVVSELIASWFPNQQIWSVTERSRVALSCCDDDHKDE